MAGRGAVRTVLVLWLVAIVNGAFVSSPGLLPSAGRLGLALTQRRMAPTRGSGPRTVPSMSGKDEAEGKQKAGFWDNLPKVHESRRYVEPYKKRDLMGKPMKVGEVTNERDEKGARQKSQLTDNSNDHENAAWVTDFLDAKPEKTVPDGWEQLATDQGRVFYRNIATGGTFTALPKEALASLQAPSPSVSEKITTTPGEGEFVKDWAAGAIPDDMYAYDSDRGGLKGGGKVIEDSEPFVDLWGDDVVGETSSSTTLGRGRELSEGPEIAWTEDEDENMPILQGLSKQRDEEEEEVDEALFGTYTLSRPDEIPSVPEDLANPMGVNEGAGTLLDQLASGQVIREGDGSVPSGLEPGHNKGQLNWAEKQLARAQQKNRPPQDLPGFAAPADGAGDESKSESGKVWGEYEVIPLWNPIPFINPEKPRVGIRKDISQQPAAAEAEATSAAAAPPPPATISDRGSGLTDDVQSAIFDDRPEMEFGYDFEESGQRGSSALVSKCKSSGRPLVRGETVLEDDRAFTFVDEHNCIGCTNCAMIARNTFFMEEDFGRARAYSQEGDADEILQEAIDSCPVDCIHPVTFEELEFVEGRREGDVINNKSRLVGGSYTAEEKGGTPWMQLLAKRVREGKARSILGF